MEEMNEKVVTEWAKKYGLSIEECAMIQPTYGGIPTEKTIEMPVKSSYGISSGVLGGANIVGNIFNLRQSSGNYKTISKFGLATGTAQLVLGLANIRKDQINWGINGYNTKISYKAQRNLSYANIVAGTATLVTSSLNLLLNKNNKAEPKNNISLYSAPSLNNEMSLGLSLVRKL